MTAVEMGALFDLLQDKSNEPYFIDTEKDKFLNFAQDQLAIKSILGNALGEESVDIPNFERAQGDIQMIHTLIIEDMDFTVASPGNLAYSTIETKMSSDSGHSNSKILGMLAVRDSFGNSARWVRHNDISKYNKNVFKKPAYTGTATTKLLFTFVHDGISFEPSGQYNIFLTAAKFPETISIGSASNTDLPRSIHNKIVAKALQLAGITTEAEALLLIDKV